MVGQQAVVNFSLQVGSITEEVVVTGEAPLVNTTSSTLASVIDQGQLADLPLNSRDLTQLSLLNPGIQRVRASISGGVIQGAAGIRVSVGGARIYSTGFLLDGSDVTDVSRGIGPGGAAGSLFGVETVKEFQVITNNFSAEYGRFVGGVMSMVTKSGTNEVHGSVFYFHRNDNLDARNFFDREDNPEFRRHQFGATIGGPIIKDKTFGFFSWEAFRQDQGFSLLNIVPTVDAKLGLFDGVIPQGGGLVDCSGVGFGSRPRTTGVRSRFIPTPSSLLTCTRIRTALSWMSRVLSSSGPRVVLSTRTFSRDGLITISPIAIPSSAVTPSRMETGPHPETERAVFFLMQPPS